MVNVIAPLMTNADKVIRQTIYYPYAWALDSARGSVLSLLVEAPTYDAPGLDPVPYVDVAGTFDSAQGKVSLYILNRDLSKAREVELVWEDKAPATVVSSNVLTGDDLKAANTFAAPQKVAPQAFAKPSTSGSRTKLEMPPRSYAAIQWSI